MRFVERIRKKVDVRTKPDPKEAAKFNSCCSRRYINVGIALRDYFKHTAFALKDNDLKEYSKYIESAIYTQDKERFDINVKLYKARLQDLGVWKQVKGISTYKKAKILAKLGKFAKKHKDQIKELQEKQKKEMEEEADEV